MQVSEAISARRSVRGFLPDAVPLETLRAIATKATRAATGGNLQPWHVDIVTGAAMLRLKALMADKLASGVVETPGYDIYPKDLVAPYRDRRFAIGEAMYAEIGIARENKDARRRWFARNFQFFGAPAAYFVTVDKRMGPPQWADLGMYLQNVMLLAVEAGLSTCAQEAWAMYAPTLEAFLATPPERLLFCGVAIGCEDVNDPANRLRGQRAPEEEWLNVIG